MKLNTVILATALWLTFSTGAAVAAPSIDAGFSPEGSAQQLVLRTLDDARESIRLMGYSFTSPDVAGADLSGALAVTMGRGQRLAVHILSHTTPSFTSLAGLCANAARSPQ